MYSENDFRYYQGGALSHAEGEKKKWNWLPGGKNPPEYNAWYYATHPEKWGITKAAKDVYNKAKDLADKTEFTDLDDRALDALGRGANKVKEGLKNNSVVGDVRRSTEALQRRDTAQRKADQARTSAAGVKDSKVAERYERQAQQYERQAAQESANARGYGNRAKNTVSRGVTNTVNRAGEAVRNAPKNISRAVNDRINKSDTLADNFARGAIQSLGKGNIRQAGRYVGLAAREAGNDLRDATRRTSKAINDRINKSDTLVDNFARGAVQSLGRGDVRQAGRYAGLAAREAGKDLRGAVDRTSRAINDRINRSDTLVDNFARGAVQSLGRGDVRQAGRYAGLAAREAGKDIRNAGQRVLDSTDLDERAAQLGRDARDAAVGAAKTAGERATQLGRDAVDAVRSVPGRVSDATGLTARRERDAARTAEANTRDAYNKWAREQQQAKKGIKAGYENGNPLEMNSALGRMMGSRENADKFREAIPEAQKRTKEAEDRYNQSPMGRAESAVRNAPANTRAAAESAASTVKSAAGKTAEEAQRLARKEVRAAISNYWDIVDKYGANSRQAQVAAQQAESRLSSSERQLLNNFGNAKNTIEDVIDNGLEWLDNIIPDFKTKK